jgi:hypothetical protein
MMPVKINMRMSGIMSGCGLTTTTLTRNIVAFTTKALATYSKCWLLSIAPAARNWVLSNEWVLLLQVSKFTIAKFKA